MYGRRRPLLAVTVWLLLVLLPVRGWASAWMTADMGQASPSLLASGEHGHHGASPVLASAPDTGHPPAHPADHHEPHHLTDGASSAIDGDACCAPGESASHGLCDVCHTPTGPAASTPTAVAPSAVQARPAGSGLADRDAEVGLLFRPPRA